MQLVIDHDYVTQTLVDLVQINSINPSLIAGSPGEAEIAEYIADSLSQMGLSVNIHEIEKGRLNVVGVLKGSGKGRSLLLNGHMDTVGVDGMAQPFSGEIKDGRLYGRGAYDMKGSLASMIGAVKALVDAGVQPGGDLLIAVVADEEFGSVGTEDLVKHYHTDSAIVTEPTDLALCRAHRGYIWYEVETFGRAAHGSRYKEGIDANMRMGRFLAQLDKLEQDLRNRPAHPLTGPPSLHASQITGGTEPSIYSAYCLLKVERRTVSGETEAQITGELQAIIDRLASEDPTFKASVRPVFARESFEIAADAPIVRVVEELTTKRLGQPPEHIGQTFWTDAAILAGAGIDTVLIGPTGHGLHSAEEWVDIQSVLDLAHILAETAISYCQ